MPPFNRLAPALVASLALAGCGENAAPPTAPVAEPELAEAAASGLSLAHGKVSRWWGVFGRWSLVGGLWSGEPRLHPQGPTTMDQRPKTSS